MTESPDRDSEEYRNKLEETNKKLVYRLGIEQMKVAKWSIRYNNANERAVGAEYETKTWKTVAFLTVLFATSIITITIMAVLL